MRKGFFDSIAVALLVATPLRMTPSRTSNLSLLTADRGWLGTDPILPMTPDKPDDAYHDDRSNHGVEFVKVLAQFAPVFSQLHAEPCECQAPLP